MKFSCTRLLEIVIKAAALFSRSDILVVGPPFSVFRFPKLVIKILLRGTSNRSKTLGIFFWYTFRRPRINFSCWLLCHIFSVARFEGAKWQKSHFFLWRKWLGPLVFSCSKTPSSNRALCCWSLCCCWSSFSFSSCCTKHFNCLVISLISGAS